MNPLVLRALQGIDLRDVLKSERGFLGFKIPAICPKIWGRFWQNVSQILKDK
jgi:hypothetical protein